MKYWAISIFEFILGRSSQLYLAWCSCNAYADIGISANSDCWWWRVVILIKTITVLSTEIESKGRPQGDWAKSICTQQ